MGGAISESTFRDVTNNGALSSSDDFKKQCFLVQPLKVCCGVRLRGGSFSKKHDLFSSSYLNRKEEWLVGEPGKNT